MKYLTTIIISCFMASCDYHYCGIKIRNESNKSLYIFQESDTALTIHSNYKSWSNVKISEGDTFMETPNLNYVPKGDSLCDCPPGIEGHYYKFLKKRYPDGFVRFFIIDKPTFHHQPWDTIVIKKIYVDVLKYSIDSLKKMNWQIEYKGKYTITNPQ